MRKNQIYALLTAALLLILVFLGMQFVDSSWRSEPTTTAVAPRDHDLVEEGPSQVQEPVPSEVGEINEP